MNLREIKFETLPKIYQDLLYAAKRASKLSYSPYSHFKVGAALLTADNEIITGTNIENAAYGNTICAERVAIFKAISEGKKDFRAIAVIGTSGDVVTPCGSCRQVIKEFAELFNYDIEIIMSNEHMTKIVISTISNLLPASFTGDVLQERRKRGSKT